MSSLDLGVIGNCAVGALVDKIGRIVWHCLPRFDGDPVFCQLLNDDRADENGAPGIYQVELVDFTRSEQEYIKNTAVLVTRLYDKNGGAVEITDFSPRFGQFGRMFRPAMIVRVVKPLSGVPRIRILLRPVYDYGARKPEITHGSNHIRYVGLRADYLQQLAARFRGQLPQMAFIDDEADHARLLRPYPRNPDIRRLKWHVVAPMSRLR